MSDQTLGDAEIADLRCLARMIIPPSAKYGVPGADDDTIFSDIVNSLGRDRGHACVTALARAAHTGRRSPRCAGYCAPCAELAAKLRAEAGPHAGVLTRIVLLCYYRDDRVMVLLGLEARPPFPKATCWSKGDWSLLDPVRGPWGNPFWRPVPQGLRRKMTARPQKRHCSAGRLLPNSR